MTSPVENTARSGSLVLYKNRPARVAQIAEKLDLNLQGGETAHVRLKDITLLHPGPLQSLGELLPQQGDVQSAWELLAGSQTTLPELADLIYGAFTPATAWAAWQLVSDGLYFRGAPGEITVCTPDDVAHRLEARRADAATHCRQLANSGRCPVSYNHLRAHETVLDLVCRILLENKTPSPPPPPTYPIEPTTKFADST